MAAFQRACRYEPEPGIPLIGVGCSAALVTDRDRRGTDRVHVAVQTIDRTTEYAMHLSRKHRDRARQESACAALILHGIGQACALDASPPELSNDESLMTESQDALPEWRELFSGKLVSTEHSIENPRLVFPGAFNPLHDGHRQMAHIAETRTGQPVLLEVSAFNVDKPALDYIELRARLAGVGDAFALTFTNAATFLEKSTLFPGATFIVGADTLERIGAPRYYRNSEELRNNAISAMTSERIRFMVFGRDIGGEFKGLDEIEIPDALRRISDGVPESEFRVDLSSTLLRRNDH